MKPYISVETKIGYGIYARVYYQMAREHPDIPGIEGLSHIAVPVEDIILPMRRMIEVELNINETP